jgi:glucose/arabinose dehydrogenase
MRIQSASKTSAAAAVLLLQACGGGGGSSSSQPPPVVTPPPEPPAIETESVFSALSFDRPVALLQAPGDDSRWFVAEQRGVVWTFDNDPATDTASVFVDVSTVVTSGGETGLLGMAFDPDFRANGEVYLSYTGSPGRVLTSVIARYRSMDGGLTLDPASEEVLLQVIQDFSNHNGGNIAFGADGFLYAGLGDGGSANDPNDRAQDTTNLLGAMLRIDVKGGSPYAIPADNPFAGNAPCTQGFGGAPCPEIFAYGLRNPWRWSFDSLTRQLWLGDVGQADWEEVNVIEVGGNYGWRIREGAHCNDNVQPNCDRAVDYRRHRVSGPLDHRARWVLPVRRLRLGARLGPTCRWLRGSYRSIGQRAFGLRVRAGCSQRSLHRRLFGWLVPDHRQPVRS